jgi:hypothetical protein
MKHTCHAFGCEVEVSEKMFMCKPQWYILTKAMRDKVWDLYIPGQERRKDPTQEYLDHTKVCIEYVKEREGK